MEELNAAPIEAHIRETKEALCDIEEDLHRMMKEDDKVSEGFDTGALMGMLANKGVDPGIIAMLNDRRDRGDWGGDGLIILFLILILGFGNNGFLGRGQAGDVAGVDRIVVNEANYSRMLDAIGGNREAIAGLAQTLNCDMNAVQSALAGVDKAIAVNQGSVINAVQSCCCTQSNQIQSTACATQRAIENQGCQTRAAIADQGAQTRELLQNNRFLIQATASAQDNLVQSLFCQQNQLIMDKFNALELRTLQDQNDRLREQIAAQSQAAQTAEILAAIRGRNAVAVNGTLNTTAGTWTGNGQISS